MACRGKRLVHRNHLRLSPVNGCARCARCGTVLECEHILVSRSWPVVFANENRFVDAKVCIDCCKMLSLGPSNDDIPDDEMQIAIGIAIGLRGHP